MADTPSDTPKPSSNGNGRPHDPLADKIRKALLGNLAENNANPEAFHRDKFERSLAKPVPPAKPSSAD